MEDTSYVSLSLEKYNELYDKAKKYDEIKFEKVKKGMFDLFEDYGHTPNLTNEESAATTEEVIEEHANSDDSTTTCKFQIGDKVIGNKKADGRYGITRKGWIGTVEEVSETQFKADNFWLDYNYFDKLEREEN